jgi:hypothetical protein
LLSDVALVDTGHARQPARCSFPTSSGRNAP